MLIAHRGGARLAPENTLEAFRSAVVDWGADMLEMDVRLTADGHVVVFHDSTLDRTTSGNGPVAERTLAEVQALDAGFHFADLAGAHSFRDRGVRVPTFEEVLEACPTVWLNVEVKERQVTRPLLQIIERHGAHHRVLVAAEHDRWRADARGYPGPWGASRQHILPFWLSHRLPFGGPYTPRVDVLQLPEVWQGLRVVTPRLIREAHRRNIPVQVWTVDDPTDMRRLLSWGVDGIQSDRPDLLSEVLIDMFGRPEPPCVRRSAAS